MSTYCKDHGWTEDDVPCPWCKPEERQRVRAMSIPLGELLVHYDDVIRRHAVGIMKRIGVLMRNKLLS